VIFLRFLVQKPPKAWQIAEAWAGNNSLGGGLQWLAAALRE
jgi:hypothetical protein